MQTAKFQQRHSRAGGNPAVLFNMPVCFALAAHGDFFINWIPASAGMTVG
jgi:hypothetical protein